MGGPYSAYTERDLGNGKVLITNRMDNSTKTLDKKEWDNPTGDPLASGFSKSGTKDPFKKDRKGR